PRVARLSESSAASGRVKNIDASLRGSRVDSHDPRIRRDLCLPIACRAAQEARPTVKGRLARQHGDRVVTTNTSWREGSRWSNSIPSTPPLCGWPSPRQPLASGFTPRPSGRGGSMSAETAYSSPDAHGLGHEGPADE